MGFLRPYSWFMRLIYWHFYIMETAYLLVSTKLSKFYHERFNEKWLDVMNVWRTGRWSVCRSRLYFYFYSKFMSWSKIFHSNLFSYLNVALHILCNERTTAKYNAVRAFWGMRRLGCINFRCLTTISNHQFLSVQQSECVEPDGTIIPQTISISKTYVYFYSNLSNNEKKGME